VVSQFLDLDLKWVLFFRNYIDREDSGLATALPIFGAWRVEGALLFALGLVVRLAVAAPRYGPICGHRDGH